MDRIKLMPKWWKVASAERRGAAIAAIQEEDPKVVIEFDQNKLDVLINFSVTDELSKSLYKRRLALAIKAKCLDIDRIPGTQFFDAGVELG